MFQAKRTCARVLGQEETLYIQHPILGAYRRSVSRAEEPEVEWHKTKAGCLPRQTRHRTLSFNTFECTKMLNGIVCWHYM